MTVASSSLRIVRDCRSERGTALVELAVVIPLLLVLVLGTVDFGRIFYRSMAIGQAARAGAEYGAQNVGTSDDETDIKTAAKNSVATDVTLTDGDIVWNRTCECATDAGTFSSTIPSNTCTGNPCPTSGTHLTITVNVTVTKSFSTLIPYPAISNSVVISRSAKLRVQ
jgi:Flp pilus assembly protein TadG